LAAKVQGLPDGFKAYSPFPFAGMNLQASPLAIADQEWYYNENFIRTGDGYLRTAWDVGSSIYTAPSGKTIVSFNFFTIGSNYFAIVFLSDGTAVQVAVPPTGSGATTVVTATANTFYLSSSGFIPAVSQWGTQFIIISNRNTPNDYWVWDGTLLYGAGTLAPTSQVNPDLLSAGTNYSSTPGTLVVGGSGTGATVVASVSDGSVVNIQVTNPGSGYTATDVGKVQVLFFGGGSDTEAYLTTSLGPSGVGALDITNNGSGYTSSPTISFSGGGGTGAAATAILGAIVTSINLSAGGTGYGSAPTVTLSGGGGSGATASATVSGGAVIGVVVTNGGSGYSSAPSVSFSGGGGTGATATSSISGTSGEVIGASITNPGTGYTSAPSVSFSGGGGTGAAATALLSQGSVQAINVVNVGSDYTGVPKISLVGGGGSGATGGVLLAGTSIASINVTAAGSGYITAPTVQIISGDGNGSGATAVAHIANGSLAYIQVTNGGSGYTSQPTVQLTQLSEGGAAVAVLAPTSIASAYVSNAGFGYTTAPAVIVEPGGNNSAAATLDLMPIGVSGSALETFNSRVWIGNPSTPLFGTLPPGGDFSFSAAGSFTDFATSDGGGNFVNSDRFLLTKYVGFRQSNGYLYAFGDGSVSVISNIQTTGTPATTTFTYQNVDPQAGLSWRDSMQDFGRSVVFGNETGIYGLYGGNVTKISEKLDRLFLNALFPPTGGALTPSGATATIFNVKHYLCLMTIVDPDTGADRNVMSTWNEKGWNVTSQGVALTFIGSQKVNSKFTAWGTDGSNLYPMFQQASSTLVKRLDTKVYGADSPFIIKDLWSLHVVAQDLSSGQSGVAGTVTFNMSGPANQQPGYNSALSGVYQNVTLGMLQFNAPSPSWPTWTSGTQGLPFNLLGMRLSTTSPDFVLSNLVLGWVPNGFTN
jgi:hypothetical protein